MIFELIGLEYKLANSKKTWTQYNYAFIHNLDETFKYCWRIIMLFTKFKVIIVSVNFFKK